MKPTISAGAIVYRRDAKGGVKFLLLYHGKGYWNFPKGKVEQGEQAMAAFLREVEEETGLRRQDLRLREGFRATDRYVFFDKRAPANQGKGRTVVKIVILYLVETSKRDVRISDEHEGFAWFTLEEATRISKYQNTKRILKQAYDYVTGRVSRHAEDPRRQSRDVRRHRHGDRASARVAPRRDHPVV
ncbi:NUDIX domain-containing protein [Candidatus Parcubacteria bacterium]|nr:MAG: NUDIX domain-containing protein [Candidatus Parcubacteria bacterium]